MLDPWNREEHYRDLAEECRRLAVTSFSIRMSNRYSRMAEDYNTLGKAGGSSAYQSAATNRFNSSERMRLAGASVRPTTPPRPSSNSRWRGPWGSRCLIP